MIRPCPTLRPSVQPGYRGLPKAPWLLACLALCTSLPVAAQDDISERVYYVPDVRAQFAALTHRADALGFGIGDSPDPTLCYHYQGIARSNGPGTPYLFVGKSGNQPPAPCFEWCNTIVPPLPCTRVGDGPGSLLVVRMGSREKTGERLRSNRISPGETANSKPDSRDTTVTVLTFDGKDEWPNFGHPGGMQAVGDVLVIPLETPYGPEPPTNLILFVDVSDPENPSLLSSFDPGESEEFSAGLVAVAPEPRGRHLMLVAGLANKEVRIFRSSLDKTGATVPLSSASLDWEHVDTFFADEDGPDTGQQICFDPSTSQPTSCWPVGSGAHQSLNFVREGNENGQLYLIGARNTGFGPLPGAGSDRIDLYRVEWEAGEFKLRWEDTKQVETFPSSEAADPFDIFAYEVANFAAASGTYVSPTGELILYATEHDNDGPSVDGKQTVKAGEWRHVDMVRRGSPTLGPTIEFGGPHVVEEGATTLLSAVGSQPVTQAWLQLWADPDYDDRYVVIDYPDRFKDTFGDFKDLDDALLGRGFSDQASSLRYFAPNGCTIRVNDDDFEDGNFPGSQTRTLPGVGIPVPFDDLNDVSPDTGGGDINDQLTSAQFFPDCDDYYNSSIDIDWDLDGIGDFDAQGNVVTYSAEFVDGPAEVAVLARATHPVDGQTTLGLTDVTVLNVAPTIESTIATDSLGRSVVDGAAPVLSNLPVTVTASFDDQFAFDTHTATIDWGDGTVTDETEADEFVEAVGAATVGRITHTHVYGSPGAYTVVITVLDDDGGSVSESFEITVLDPDAAIGEVANAIDDLLAMVTDPNAIALLLDARDALIGNNDGKANNGALDHLEGDRLNPPFLRLSDAIASLLALDATGAASTFDLQATLVLGAQALAVGSFERAAAANPLPQAAQKLEDAAAAISDAASLALSGDFMAAVDRLREAVRITESLY